MISAKDFANNIIERSFHDGIELTPEHLHRIIYFTYATYLKKNRSADIGSAWLTTDAGPALEVLHTYFDNTKKITKYVKVAGGESFVIDEDRNPTLRLCLDLIWSATKHRSAVELSDISRSRGSAWARTKKRKRNTIARSDIEEDMSFFAPLGLSFR